MTRVEVEPDSIYESGAFSSGENKKWNGKAMMRQFAFSAHV